MKSRVIVFTLLTVGLFALCLTASWGLTFARMNPEGVPLKGHGKGILTQTALSSTSWSVKVQGTGQATHLGRVTVEISHDEVNLAPTGDNLLPGIPTGRGVITTANGDQVFGTFTWLGLPTPTSGLLAIAGTFTITGGTGKYEGATGEGFYVGTGYIPTNEITTQIEGTISIAKKENPKKEK